MKKRRIILWIMMGCSMIIVLIGCKKEHNSRETVDNKPTVFRFFNIDSGNAAWDNPVAEAITKSTGVSLEMEYPLEDGSGQISLMIATSDYPDLIYAKGESQKLIENDVLIDLRELIDQYGPNIKKIYGAQYEWLRYSSDNPAIYQLSSSPLTFGECYSTGSVQLQYAVLDKNDYKVPKTLEEYEMMLKDYIEQYPEIDGKPTIGLSIVSSDWRWMITMGNPSGFIANGSPDDGQWLVDENMNLTYKHRNEKQREFYRWLNQMYQDNVLDQEFATQSYEDYLVKISEGRVLSVMDKEWDYGSSVIELNLQGKAERTYAQIPLTTGPDVPFRANLQSGRCAGWGIGITTACKNPVQAIKFIDYLCSDEGQVLLNWGIKNANYFIDEEGRRYRTQEEATREKTDLNYKVETGVGYHAFPFPTYPIDAKDANGNYYSPNNSETEKLQYNSAEKKAIQQWGVERLSDIFPAAIGSQIPQYPTIWLIQLPVELSERIDQLNQIAWNGLVQCIICDSEEFDDSWKQLQQELVEEDVEMVESQITEIFKSRIQFYNN